MTETTAAASALDVARAFGDAYARADVEKVAALLHPDVHERMVTPSSIVDQRGAAAVVGELAAFVAPYARPEILLNEVVPLGSLFRWTTRWRLSAGADAGVVEWHAFLGVREGRVDRLDAVCSGVLADTETAAATEA